MENSILYFLEKGIKNLEKVEEKFWKDPENMNDLILGIRNVTEKLAQDILAEILEGIDTMIREDAHRVKNWYIVRKDQKQLFTTLGTITFHKTLFKNRETGESEYLLDRLLGMEPHERMTEEAEARMLEEVAEVSYRKAGGLVSPVDGVSRQTVKNKIHRLEFPALVAPLKKREVEYLYIDADEDHVKLQYQQKKGDLTVNGQNRKNNGEIVKLIYVYEGIEKEAPKSKRHKLIHPHYFSGTYEGEENKGLWDVDNVITTRELARMIKQANIDFIQLEDSQFDEPMGEATGAGAIFGTTGGVMEAALRTAQDTLTGKDLAKIDFKDVRGGDGIKRAAVNIAGKDINVVAASGLGNARKILEEIKSGKADYQFVEIMACPGGCVMGGGQPIKSSKIRSEVDVRALRANALYSIDEKSTIRKSHENPIIKKIYEEYLEKPGSYRAEKLLHTEYIEREKYKV